MIRLVRNADAPEIKQWLKDFGLETTEEKIRQRQQSHITFIEPGVGYAELKPRSDIQVSSLFPEGADVELLQPALDKCFAEVAKTYDLDTNVWARFFGGKDARGRPDGGKSKCEAWHRLYPKTVIVPPELPGGLWEIRAKLGDLI